MIPVGVAAALLTAVAYGATPACARRAIRLLGFARANVWRLLVALPIMGLLTSAVGQGISDESATFALAGAVGFGVGGFAMFRALPLLGAPLASLLVETIAALCAGVLAWVWFADTVDGPAALFSIVILAGVVIGLVPYVRVSAHGGVRHPRLRLGILFAVIAAVAQAFSGVLSRKALLAVQHAETVGDRVGGSFQQVFSAAFDRLVGGLLIAVVLLLLARMLAGHAEWANAALRPVARGPEPGSVWTDPDTRLGRLLPDRAWFWVGANALLGPIVGVTAMVWALQSLQPGVAQAIAAMAPLIAIPAARWVEGYRVPAGYLVGVAIAVFGLVGLAL